MLDMARLTSVEVLERFDTTLQGLRTATASKRLKQYGINDVAREPQVSLGARLWSNIANPLVVLLAGLALVSYLTNDLRGTIVILAMIVLGVVLRFFQEVRADLLYGFGALENPAFFQTAWFIESIFSQTLVIHVIRTNKIPFIQSMASWPLLLSSFAILGFAAWLTVSPFAPALGFVTLPTSFWLTNFALLLAYIPLTQLLKVWFIRRYGI